MSGLEALIAASLPDLAQQASSSGYPLFTISRLEGADAYWAAMAQTAGLKLISQAAEITFIRSKANTQEGALQSGLIRLNEYMGVGVDPEVVCQANEAGQTAYVLVTPSVWFRIYFLTFPLPTYDYQGALAHLGLVSRGALAQLPSPPLNLSREATLLAKNIPSANPCEDPPDGKTLSLIPRKLLEHYNILPQRVVDDGLFLYMTDPEDALVKAQVKNMTGLVIKPVMMTAEEAREFWALHDAAKGALELAALP